MMLADNFTSSVEIKAHVDVRQMTISARMQYEAALRSVGRSRKLSEASEYRVIAAFFTVVEIAPLFATLSLALWRFVLLACVAGFCGGEGGSGHGTHQDASKAFTEPFIGCKVERTGQRPGATGELE